MLRDEQLPSQANARRVAAIAPFGHVDSLVCTGCGVREKHRDGVRAVLQLAPMAVGASHSRIQ
jgi:hypothetical protein